MKCHRDIKPENILFSASSPDSTLKIIDFGRSKILKINQKITDLAGSLNYIAPEVLSGKEYCEKCDIWSCGIIMHALLLGTPPFYNKDQEALIEEIKEGYINYTSILTIINIIKIRSTLVSDK
jgi:calcium-dependent protein kinase